MTPYPLRVPLAVPYWNNKTYQAAFDSILTGRVVEGPARGALKDSIIQKLSVAGALLCGSGSLALEVVLDACGVGPGDEVVIPTFCCTAVVPPILNLGAVPAFADVGDELNMTAENVETALTQRTRAVIVPHLFGNPAEIETICDLARAKDIRVIDDAAQALGATIDGRPVESFGDAGILSFGAEKVCFGIGGGVAISRNKEMFQNVYQQLPSALSEVRRFLSLLTLHRWRRWTFPFDSAKPEPSASPIPYRREGMANLSAAVALSLVRNLDKNIAARRERVKMYRQQLEQHERLHLIPHRPGSACLAQVVRILPTSYDDDPATRVIDALRAGGHEVQGSYVPIHLLSPYGRWRRHFLPYAEKVWSDLVELPCEPDVSIEDVERIAAIVKQTVL